MLKEIINIVLVNNDGLKIDDICSLASHMTIIAQYVEEGSLIHQLVNTKSQLKNNLNVFGYKVGWYGYLLYFEYTMING